MAKKDNDEILILLALLAVPECRVRAGFPPRGPLSKSQIARYVGMSPAGIAGIEKKALRKIKLALAKHYD